MSWISNLAPDLSTRGPLTLSSFLTNIFPTFILYYVTAVLIQLPKTQLVRVALAPLSFWSIYRAATTVDVTSNFDDPEPFAYLNQGLVLVMCVATFRIIEWTARTKPYTRRAIPQSTEKPRVNGAANGDAKPAPPTSLGLAAYNAFDLCTNLRGYGWDWAQGLASMPEKRSTTSTTTFLAQTLQSFVTYLVGLDLAHRAVQSFGPSTIGSPVGGSIFDPSLAPIPRYVRSTGIVFLSAFLVYSAIQLSHDLLAIIGVVIFRQHPAQWGPALFNSPLNATSLQEQWGKRWHQLFRQCFISVGVVPMYFLFGRVGGVLGAFLASAVYHDLGLWGMNRGDEFPAVGGFFLMMGIGVILEVLWKKATGSRVGGVAGWIWTTVWVYGWGNVLIDAWTRKGMVGSVFLPHEARPSTHILRLVDHISGYINKTN